MAREARAHKRYASVPLSLHKDLFALNLFLQFQQPVQQRFRPRRATGNIHIDRNDLVHALHDGVTVVVIAGGRAGSHGDDVTPVSYTHLDVYKRQRFTCFIIFLTGTQSNQTKD